MSGGIVAGRPHASALDALFRPRRIAFYGASDNSSWSHHIYSATRAWGFDGDLYAINRRGAPAHGMPGFVSAQAVPERLDAAYVFVPLEGVLGAIRDLAAAGAKGTVVLTSGFAETGAAGEALQSQLVAEATQLGLHLLGPNSLGFGNPAAKTALTSMPATHPVLPGHVALVSQSGATCSELIDFAHQQGIGLSFFVATGNEAMLDIAVIVDYLVDDPATRVIAIFAETIRNPARFLAAAQRAFAARKPVVILKVGASEISAAVAMAHTGSLVGDERAFQAACVQYGIVRATSIEELVTTAGVLAHTGALQKPGVAVVSISGGACGLFGDAAEKAGVPLPAFTPATVTALRAVQASYGATLNPFDITGAAVADPSMFEKCLDIIGSDPGVGLTVCAVSLPSHADRVPVGRHLLTPVGASLRRLGSKGLLMNASVKPVNETGREVLAATGVPAVFGGIDQVVRALGHALWWSQRVLVPGNASTAVSHNSQRPVGERAVLEYLAGFGVPVIPALIAATAEEAVAAARRMNAPVVLKIASPDIQHKTEVGGVQLNLQGDDSVAAGFTAMLARVRQAKPDARIDGVIVSPMRDRGVELLVGTANDPQWGAMIVVGLGGVWVEVLRDTALRLLPVAHADAIEMLRSLRAVKLLQGYRGAPAADLDAIADVVVRIGHAALALGPDLAALEINPLRVAGAQVEALDALTVWKDDAQ